MRDYKTFGIFSAAALRRAGRIRGIEDLAAEIHATLRRPQLRQDPLVEQAMGIQARRLLAALNTECDSVDQLSEVTSQAVRQHPDYTVITSFPGLADISGARIIAELGDDRTRFADARCLNAFAGSAPVTRASGRSLIITHRRVKNDRLAAVGFTWGLAAPTTTHRVNGPPRALRQPVERAHESRVWDCTVFGTSLCQAAGIREVTESWVIVR